MKRITEIFSSGLRLLTRNSITLLGTALILVSAVIILASVVYELFVDVHNPYRSLVTFAVLPGVLAFGIMLVSVGLLRYRRHRGQETPPVLDLRIPRHRNLTLFFATAVPVTFVLLFFGTFKAYEYTESVEFCGSICHDVMQPEFVAYKRGQHARVRCAECHIGPGAPWLVRSKITGAAQLLAVMTGHYSRPIPSPVESLRPARDTCEQCHWPDVFHGKKLLARERIGEEASIDDPMVSAVILNIGGYNKRTQRNAGIHWHISSENKVEYLATDSSRMKIKQVRVHRADGTQVEYVDEGLPDPVTGTVWRTMDCMDCHNRPAHQFQDPDDALDELLLSGQIDGSIDGIRGVVYEAITGEYETQEDGELAIRTAMRKLFRQEAADRRDIIPEVSISAAVELYKSNVFPEMEIEWNTYKNHIGHRDGSPGCFRCHNEELVTENDDFISQDCELCHDVLAEDELASELEPNIKAYLTSH